MNKRRIGIIAKTSLLQANNQLFEYGYRRDSQKINLIIFAKDCKKVTANRRIKAKINLKNNLPYIYLYAKLRIAQHLDLMTIATYFISSLSESMRYTFRSEYYIDFMFNHKIKNNEKYIQYHFLHQKKGR